MTTTKVPAGARPALDRKPTRKSEENRESALDQGIKITIDDEVYEARIGDVTPDIARELRARSGMGFIRLVNEAAQDPDIDLISAIVWVARRIRGEDVDFGDVNVTYRQMLSAGFDVALPGAEDLGGDHPEG